LKFLFYLLIKINYIKIKTARRKTVAKIKNGDKVYIISNGHQSPYLDGEVMNVIPAMRYHVIREQISHFSIKPIMRLNRENGPQINLEDLWNRE
jgi:hypothetical protein